MKGDCPVDKEAQALGRVNEAIAYARELLRKASVEVARIERAAERLSNQLNLEEG